MGEPPGGTTKSARHHHSLFDVSQEWPPDSRIRRRELAAEIAAVTRAGYTDSDLFPGLPEPDGSFESAEQVDRELSTGHRLWVARDDKGALLGLMRMFETPEGTWNLHKMGIWPAWKGLGIPRALLTTADRAAAAQDKRIRFDAVVERCLPALYEQMGYLPIKLSPAGDKPLTEWRMERHSSAPETTIIGHPTVGSGLFLCWFVTHGRLLATVRHATGINAALQLAGEHLPSDAALAGMDHLPGAQTDQAHRLLRHLPSDAEQTSDGTYALGQSRPQVPFHLLPRSFEPDLLSVVRYAPGRELSLPTEIK